MVYNLSKRIYSRRDYIMPINAQNVTLSDNAYNIIKNDVSIFYTKKNNLKFNGILNRIIQNYSGKSSADFSYISADIQQKINTALKHCNLPKKVSKENIASSILYAYKKAFFEEKNKPIHGKSFKFSIVEKSNNILESNCNINPYQNDNNRYLYLGKYLHYLFEDYASQPISFRERIVFAEIYEKIHKAINNNYLIKAQLNNGIFVYIKPYKINIDPETQYNYLIGFSHFESNSTSSIYSYRISKLLKINFLNEKYNFTDKEKAELKKALELKTPAYISYDMKTIKVLLTKRGETFYSTLQHNRPSKTVRVKPINNELSEYTINCSEVQAKNYFLKFGSEAIIIEPENLRNAIKNEFIKAESNYTNTIS